ncbi:MAG TPA: apolipoprotein N-acyltransferase [Micromonosporaceae bacterium]
MTMLETLPAPAAAASAAPRPRPLPAAAAALAAALAGVALLAAFPPYDVWWLAPVGVALLAAAAHRRRIRAGAGLGLLAGLVFFLPLLSWTDLHLSSTPWLLLSVLEAGYLALLGATTAFVGPLVDRFRWAWAPVTGVLWVAQEALRDRTPFGGFPWGRLAFSQGDSPMLRLAALGGAPLVTFAVAVVGGMLVAAVWRPWRGRSGRLAAAAYLAGAAGVSVAGFAVPTGAASGAATATVAIVQGNVPRLGLDFNAQRQAVLNNHVDATIELAARVAAGSVPQPDLVVWPENSSDIDPLLDASAAARISAAADAVGAPVLVGAVLAGPGERQVRNVGLLWHPGTGPDVAQMYVKRHPVPFAEYVPMRDVARLVSKEVDRVRNDFVPGLRPGVLRLDGLTVGDVICFEVAYDSVVRDTVTGGAQLLAVQTNNATFNEAEARQQLAMVRLRAVEHGRTALMASTVGVSGFVSADGRVSDATGFFTPAVVVRTVPLADGRTPATRLGAGPEIALTLVAVGVLAGAAVIHRRTRSGGEVSVAEAR